MSNRRKRLSALEILKRLRELDETKAMGVDGLHPRVLRKCADVLAAPVALILKKSITTGDVTT
jgi:hypothetical protein